MAKTFLLAVLLAVVSVEARADDDFKLQVGRPAEPFNPLRAGESPIRDNELYQAYLARRAERRYAALQLRREYNLSKGPAVYYRYNPNAMPVFWSAIQQGWVQQPPIPRYSRPRVYVAIPDYVPSHSN